MRVLIEHPFGSLVACCHCRKWYAWLILLWPHMYSCINNRLHIFAQANPHVLLGALLEGTSDGTDSFPDVRTNNGSQVGVGRTAPGSPRHWLRPTRPSSPHGQSACKATVFFSSDPVCSIL